MDVIAVECSPRTAKTQGMKVVGGEKAAAVLPKPELHVADGNPRPCQKARQVKHQDNE